MHALTDGANRSALFWVLAVAGTVGFVWQRLRAAQRGRAAAQAGGTDRDVDGA